MGSLLLKHPHVFWRPFQKISEHPRRDFLPLEHKSISEVAQWQWQQRVWTHLSNEVHPSIFATFWNRHSDNHTSCSDCQVCTGAKVWSNQGRTVLKSTVTPICMKQCISCVSLMSVYIKLSGFYYEAVIVNAIYWSSRLALTVINHRECTS